MSYCLKATLGTIAAFSLVTSALGNPMIFQSAVPANLVMSAGSAGNVDREIPVLNPWGVLAGLSGSASAAIVCASSVAAGQTGEAASATNVALTPPDTSSAEQAPPTTGCVLPVMDSAVAANGPPVPIPVPPVESPAAIPLLPVILGTSAAASATAGYLAFGRNGNNEGNSPA